MTRPICAATLAFAFAASAALAQSAGQTPPSPQPETPKFRSSIQAVQIDIRVTDPEGNPVTGLTQDDFELLENGRPQPITTFAAIDIPLPSHVRTDQPIAERDVSSNDQPRGRVYLFALDEVAPCSALRTRHFLREFLDRHFGPHDVAAVALVGKGLATTGQEFTGNRRLLLDAIDRFSGGFGQSCGGGHSPPGNLRGGRSQQMASLRELTEAMARIPGRHKAMLLFTEAIEVDMFDIVDYSGGILGLAGVDAHAAMTAATRGNLTIYPIDPTGLTTEHIPLATLASLTALGHITGGFALFNSNSFSETFDRIVREHSTYYVLGFNSANERNDGRYVRVEVRPRRPGLTVRARDGYVAPTRDERRTETRTAAASVVSSALASPLSESGVSLRVVATPHKGVGRHARVMLSVEIDASTLDLVERNGRFTGTLDVRYLVTDGRKRSYPESRHISNLELDPDARGRGVRVVSELDLPKGRYQVRIAAGMGLSAGSVVHDLEVPDFPTGPLTMSGVSVTTASAADVTTLRADAGGQHRQKPKGCALLACTSVAEASRALVSWPSKDGTAARDLWHDALPAPPTTRREFEPGETLSLFAEVYDTRTRRRLEAAYEIELTTELRGRDGSVVRSLSERRPSTAATRTDGGHGFTVRLPLDGLPAGSYSLHLTASADAVAGHTVSRTVPIRVK